MTDKNDKKTPLELAREAKAKREAESASKAEANELKALELDERLASTLGTRGEDYEIVVAPEGPIGLRLGDALVFKRFSKSKVDEADIDAFVIPCLAETTIDQYKAIVAKRPLVGVRCASALSALFGVKAEADVGKF